MGQAVIKVGRTFSRHEEGQKTKRIAVNIIVGATTIEGHYGKNSLIDVN